MEAQILPCPEYQKLKILMKFLALEKGNTIFDLNQSPTLLKNTDTSQTLKLRSSVAPSFYTFLGPN